MSRILLVTLAVLFLLLAFVFSKTLLYALAILLFGLALVHYLYERRNEFFPAGMMRPQSGKVTPPEDDLRSLGIIEIKPRPKTSNTTDLSADDEESVSLPVDKAKESPQRTAARSKRTDTPLPQNHTTFSGMSEKMRQTLDQVKTCPPRGR